MKLTPEQQLQIRKELARRKLAKEQAINKTSLTIQRMLNDCFPAQKAFILDPSRKKIALCGRRAGKSTADAILMFKTALENPNVDIYYFSFTISTAKEIIGRILTDINDRYNIGAEVMTEEVRFQNGSRIKLKGINANDKLVVKNLGTKLKLAVLDEAQDFTVDVNKLLDQVLKYALVDLKGTVVLTGTASDYLGSKFYDLTKDYTSKAGYSFHTWSGLDNPNIAPQLREEIEQSKLENPLYEQTDAYKQHVLCQWVINKDALVYKPNESNFIDLDELPNDDGYSFILGVDLGFNDEDAFIVCAQHERSNRLFVVEAHKKAGNDDIATAQSIKNLDRRFGFTLMVIDGASKKSVETMRQRFNLNLIAAEKTEKADYIRMFNEDLAAGVIKILNQPKPIILEEWSKLIWNPGSKKPKEKDGLPNHASDALLYAWRMATNWANEEANQSDLIVPEYEPDEWDKYTQPSAFEFMEKLYRNRRDTL